MHRNESPGLGGVDALPVEMRRHTYDHVYRTLRRALATGQIPEGTRLVETELAERLGVSRTPVRDALRRLESDGFAERRRGGLWSRAIGPADIEDLFLIRGRLDELAAQLACERAEPEQWSEPRSLIIAMDRAAAEHGQASEEFGDAHMAFHTSIYRIAFGVRFAGFIGDHLLQYIEVAADLSYREPELTLPVVDQHEQLLAELVAGDVSRAVDAARAHARRGATDAQSARAAAIPPPTP